MISPRPEPISEAKEIIIFRELLIQANRKLNSYMVDIVVKFHKRKKNSFY